MTYSDIKLSPDQTYFSYRSEKLFGTFFLQALKFHKEGLAAVCDDTGWYHIDLQGIAMIPSPYKKLLAGEAFSFYLVKKMTWQRI